MGATPEIAIRADQQGTMETMTGESHKADGPAQPPPRDAASAKPRLLAVDDVADSAELIARMAEKSGYEAQHTTDPTMVGSLIRSWQPTLVVTDICMPKMDAIELFKILQETGYAGDVFLVSGQADRVHEYTTKLAALHGVNVVGSMRKPIDIREFRAFLTGLLQAA